MADYLIDIKKPKLPKKIIINYFDANHIDIMKLKGNTKLCYATIRLYDNNNPELISYIMEQEHSL